MTHYAVELENVIPQYGWQGGPSADTEIQMQRNQHERRNARGDVLRHYYNLPFGAITRADYLLYLKAAHMAMYGQAHSFLVKDWLDFDATNESLGNAPSGTTAVQLIKTYSFGGVASYVRDITKPVAGVVVKQNGVTKAGTLDTETGLFTPTTAWTAGQPLTWTGEFRVAVRFNNDYMPMTIDTRSNGQHLVSGSVELIEVFGE